jgi:YHYH protein
VSGLAQDNFSVEQGELYLKVEFFKDGGTNSLDSIRKSLVGQLELDRKSFSENFQAEKLGQALWRNYAFEVRTPFAEVDTVKVSIGFAKGNGKGANSEFWVRELEVLPIPTPPNYVPPANSDNSEKPVALQSLVKLGGRWYYDPRDGDKTPPSQFDHTNVDRLYYFTDRLETPFVGNVTAWLQPNFVDREGKKVKTKRPINDSVVITFTDKHLVMKSQNIPNHPVAVFPDVTGFQGGNPGVIRELNQTWSIPLEPKENPNRGAAITMQNKTALPMGPIGVAVNGVVFYNPFDGPGFDATLQMDRCCGHTGPTSQYHYHKYPVCINTPWADDGEAHSPLIGFAFDGFPVYGPYESKGVLAKDSTYNPLNDFNVHNDEARGPHYHVTPGNFPHIIGGYWGEVEQRSRGGRGPR